jgi:hypothetical protein
MLLGVERPGEPMPPGRCPMPLLGIGVAGRGGVLLGMPMPPEDGVGRTGAADGIDGAAGRGVAGVAGRGATGAVATGFGAAAGFLVAALFGFAADDRRDEADFRADALRALLRAVLLRAAERRPAGFRAVALRAEVLRAEVLRAAPLRAVDFRAVLPLAVLFLAVVFRADLRALVLRAVFLAAVFRAAVFRAGLRRLAVLRRDVVFLVVRFFPVVLVAMVLLRSESVAARGHRKHRRMRASHALQVQACRPTCRVNCFFHYTLFATENGNLVARKLFIPTNESILLCRRTCEVAHSALQQRKRTPSR